VGPIQWLVQKLFNANLGMSGGMPPNFTSPAETFHIRSIDISVTTNKSMSSYAKYLLPGQVLLRRFASHRSNRPKEAPDGFSPTGYLYLSTSTFRSRAHPSALSLRVSHVAAALLHHLPRVRQVKLAML